MLGTYAPAISTYPNSTEGIGTPSVHTGLVDDVYLTLVSAPRLAEPDHARRAHQPDDRVAVDRWRLHGPRHDPGARTALRNLRRRSRNGSRAEGSADPDERRLWRLYRSDEEGRRVRRRRAVEADQTATSVRVADGKTNVLDGPYADTKEQLGGYYMIDVPDMDAAISWAARCPGASTGTMEVRPIWPMAEYRCVTTDEAGQSHGRRQKRPPGRATASWSPISRRAPATWPAPRTRWPMPLPRHSNAGREPACPRSRKPGCWRWRGGVASTRSGDG